MQDELDIPASADDLYEARGDVPISLPLMQGDVFTDIPVPGLGSAPLDMIIVSHPCTMRSGATLRARLTVAPVAVESQKINEFVWKKHVNKMPLPDLMNDGAGSSADFRDVAPVQTSDLDLRKRVAVLSSQGVLLLQQRHIFAHTRFIVDVGALGEASGPVFLETELQREWVEAYLDANSGGGEAEIGPGIAGFQDWLSDDHNARRQKLRQVHLYTDLRRETRREIAKRFM